MEANFVSRNIGILNKIFRGTPYDDLLAERLRPKGVSFRLQDERVGTSLVEVFKRVGKYVIWVCETVQKG